MNRTSWGMRFNQHPEYKRFSTAENMPDCPDWFEQRQFNVWQEEGLIVWNNVDKKIEALNGSYTLRLLNQLESQNNWKTEGISVTKLVSEFSFEAHPRGRRKKTEQKTETTSTGTQPFYKEMLHLPAEAGPELIELINANKSIISNMAKTEKKRYDDAIHQFIEAALDFSHKEETEKFDFSARQFQWLPNGSNRWMCKHQTAEGRVCVDETKWFWCACTNRQGSLEKSEHFKEFSSAIEWVETELVNIINNPELPDLSSHIRTEQERKEALTKLRHKLQSSPFWIDPSVIEPDNISFKILIQIEATPTKFDTITTRCGDTIRVNERFPGQSKLAMIIGLDRDQFNFTQPLGDNSDWHLITSLTTFYQENSAAEQSQKTWNQSRIAQQFKEKNIRRARYGYQEVETGFEIYLGACESSDDPWWIPETRAGHMEQLAFRESLSYSLDANDFRDFLGLSTQSVTDDQIQHIMHSTRASSKHIPEAKKVESKIWLAKHDLT